MEFIVGITLALFVCGAAAWPGMDRDRVFYPTVLIVIATYYALFAVIDGRNDVLLSELAIASVWPGFCLTFDVTAAAVVAVVMVLRAGSKRKRQNLGIS